MRLAVLTALLLALPAAAQPLTTPRVSPHARVEQTVGLTRLAVDYHRPAVEGRRVWGDLVPFGQVWRLGANENTTFETSTDIAVEGAPLPAGRYGLHAIPTLADDGQHGAWTIAFSRMADAWGSYSYTPDEDALRVTVTPATGRPHAERLLFRFDAPDEAGATLVMHWEALELSIRIEPDTPAVVLASMERELRGVAAFSWEGWNQIAEYALDHGRRLPEALAWAERSIELSPTFANAMTRAALLERLGRADEAATARDGAFVGADPETVRAWARSRRRAGDTAAADAALARIR
jgi:hypothetical protein